MTSVPLVLGSCVDALTAPRRLAQVLVRILSFTQNTFDSGMLKVNMYEWKVNYIHLNYCVVTVTPNQIVHSFSP